MPAASSAAMMGMTLTEQSGETAPKAAASRMAMAGRPRSTRAICPSAPVAEMAAARATESRK